MSHHTPTDIDPATIAQAQKLWHNFTQSAKWGIIGLAVLLLGMAFLFIH
jgi:hypothetical protein